MIFYIVIVLCIVYTVQGQYAYGDYTCAPTIENFGTHSLLINNKNGSQGVCVPISSEIDGVLEQNVSDVSPLVFGGSLTVYNSSDALVWGTLVDPTYSLSVNITASVNYDQYSAPYCDPEILLQLMPVNTVDTCQYSLDVSNTTVVCVPFSPAFFPDGEAIFHVADICGVNLTGSIIFGNYRCDISLIPAGDYLMQFVLAPPIGNASCASSVYSQLFTVIGGFNSTDGIVDIPLVNRTEGCVPTIIPACVPMQSASQSPSVSMSISPGCIQMTRNTGYQPLVFLNAPNIDNITNVPLGCVDSTTLVYNEFYTPGSLDSISVTGLWSILPGGMNLLYDQAFPLPVFDYILVGVLTSSNVTDIANDTGVLVSISYSSVSYAESLAQCNEPFAYTTIYCEFLDSFQQYSCDRVSPGINTVIENRFNCSLPSLPVGEYLLEISIQPTSVNTTQIFLGEIRHASDSGGTLYHSFLMERHCDQYVVAPECTAPGPVGNYTCAAVVENFGPHAFMINSMNSTNNFCEARLHNTDQMDFDAELSQNISLVAPFVIGGDYKITSWDEIRLFGTLLNASYGLVIQAVASLADYNASLPLAPIITLQLLPSDAPDNCEFSLDQSPPTITCAIIGDEYIPNGMELFHGQPDLCGVNLSLPIVTARYTCALPTPPGEDYSIKITVFPPSNGSQANVVYPQILLAIFGYDIQNNLTIVPLVDRAEGCRPTYVPPCVQSTPQTFSQSPTPRIPAGNLTCTPTVQNFGPDPLIINNFNGTNGLCARALPNPVRPIFADGTLGENVTVWTPFVIGGEFEYTSADYGVLWGTEFYPTPGITVHIVATTNYNNFTSPIEYDDYAILKQDLPIVWLQPYFGSLDNTCPDNIPQDDNTIVCTFKYRPTLFSHGFDYYDNDYTSPNNFCGVPLTKDTPLIDIYYTCNTSLLGPSGRRRGLPPMYEVLLKIFPGGINASKIVYEQMYVRLSGLAPFSDDRILIPLLEPTEGCRPVDLPGCVVQSNSNSHSESPTASPVCKKSIRNSGDAPLVFLNQGVPDHLTDSGSTCEIFPLAFNQVSNASEVEYINITGHWSVTGSVMDLYYQMFEMTTPMSAVNFTGMIVEVYFGTNNASALTEFGVQASLSVEGIDYYDYSLPCHSDFYSTIPCTLVLQGPVCVKDGVCYIDCLRISNEYTHIYALYFSCPFYATPPALGGHHPVEISIAHNNSVVESSQVFLNSMYGTTNPVNIPFMRETCTEFILEPECVPGGPMPSPSISQSAQCIDYLRDSGPSEWIYLRAGTVDTFTSIHNRCNADNLIFDSVYDPGNDVIGILGGLEVSGSAQWSMYGMLYSSVIQNIYVSILQPSNDGSFPTTNGVLVYFRYGSDVDHLAPCNDMSAYTEVVCGGYSAEDVSGSDCGRAKGNFTYLWREYYACTMPVLNMGMYLAEISVVHDSFNAYAGQVFISAVTGEFFDNITHTFDIPLMGPACTEFAQGSECPHVETHSHSLSPSPSFECVIDVANSGHLFPLALVHPDVGDISDYFPNIPNCTNYTELVFNFEGRGPLPPGTPDDIHLLSEWGISHGNQYQMFGLLRPTHAFQYIDVQIAATGYFPNGYLIDNVTVFFSYAWANETEGPPCNSPPGVYFVTQCHLTSASTGCPGDYSPNLVQTEALNDYRCPLPVLPRGGYFIEIAILHANINPMQSQIYLDKLTGIDIEVNETFYYPIPMFVEACTSFPLPPICGSSQSASESTSTSLSTSPSPTPRFGCSATAAELRNSNPPPHRLAITNPTRFPRPGFYPPCYETNEFVFSLNNDLSPLTLGEPDDIRMTTTLTISGGQVKMFAMSTFQPYPTQILLDLLANGDFTLTPIISNVTVTLSYATVESCADQVPCSFPSPYTVIACPLIDRGTPCGNHNETENLFACSMPTGPDLPDGTYLVEIAILHANVDPTQSQVFLDFMWAEYGESSYDIPILNIGMDCEGVLLYSACNPCDSGLVVATEPYVMEFARVPGLGGPVPAGLPLCSSFGELVYNRDFMLGDENIGIMGPFTISSDLLHFSMFAMPTLSFYPVRPDTLIVEILATGNFTLLPPLDMLNVYLAYANASDAHDEAVCNAPYGSYTTSPCSLDILYTGYGCPWDSGCACAETQAFYTYDCPLPSPPAGDYLLDLTILSPTLPSYESALFLDKLTVSRGLSQIVYAPFMNNCAIGTGFSLNSVCAGAEPESPCDPSGNTNLTAYYRGSVLETFNDTDACFVDYMLTPASNFFQNYMGVSIPVVLFDSTPPSQISFTVAAYGGYSPTNFMLSYTATCGAPIPIQGYSASFTYPDTTPFPTDCPRTFAQQGNTLPYQLVSFSIHPSFIPIPPGTVTLDIVFPNVPAGTVLYIGDITIETNDFSVTYNIDDEPCSPTLLPTAPCECVQCAHCIGAPI